MPLALVALGANLAEPAVQVRAALAALSRLSGARLLRASSLYRTAPVGIHGQPDFINAVAALETELAPHALLARREDHRVQTAGDVGPAGRGVLVRGVEERLDAGQCSERVVKTAHARRRRSVWGRVGMHASLCDIRVTAAWLPWRSGVCRHGPGDVKALHHLAA